MRTGTCGLAHCVCPVLSLQPMSEAWLPREVDPDMGFAGKPFTWDMAPGNPGLGSEIGHQRGRCGATYHEGLLELCPLGNLWGETSQSTSGRGGWGPDPLTPALIDGGQLPGYPLVPKESPQARSGPDALNKAAPEGWRWAPRGFAWPRLLLPVGRLPHLEGEGGIVLLPQDGNGNGMGQYTDFLE